MNSFQHVDYCGMEFVLRYKRPNGWWAAYDENMNAVGIQESFCEVQGCRADWNGVPVTEPIYFRESKKDELFMTSYPDMIADIRAGKTQGKITDDQNMEWEWDIDKLMFKSSNGCEAMRVMTPGGWWL